ncbi:MAG TPA: hypothetical protein VGM56_01665 [Byssovorax sp.]
MNAAAADAGALLAEHSASRVSAETVNDTPAYAQPPETSAASRIQPNRFEASTVAAGEPVDASAKVPDANVAAVSEGSPAGHLEAALLLAAQAGRFDVVATLAAEIQARRLAGSNVLALDTVRSRRS